MCAMLASSGVGKCLPLRFSLGALGGVGGRLSQVAARRFPVVLQRSKAVRHVEDLQVLRSPVKVGT